MNSETSPLVINPDATLLHKLKWIFHVLTRCNRYFIWQFVSSLHRNVKIQPLNLNKFMIVAFALSARTYFPPELLDELHMGKHTGYATMQWDNSNTDLTSSSAWLVHGKEQEDPTSEENTRQKPEKWQARASCYTKSLFHISWHIHLYDCAVWADATRSYRLNKMGAVRSCINGRVHKCNQPNTKQSVGSESSKRKR